MSKKSRGFGLSIVGLLAMAWTSAAQEPKGTGEVIKEKVGQAVESVKKGAGQAEEAVKDQYSKAKESVQKLSIDHRVYGRLHWDKTLNAAKIEVKPGARAGAVILVGTVADANARNKAYTLALDTVGVTQVDVAQLRIGPPVAPAKKVAAPRTR
jgi:hyperosmotically inducible periplasmic protein